ncbi:MAG: phenylalanine--tRNA ligase subunit beta, partial [Candidatus Nealsonbacteria bacterium CG03_land_8_20_14_0_80_36_12]
MTFSYNWLQDYIKKTLPKPEKLAELLTMHFFEVEGVKKIGKDWVFDIAVLPNRAADCLSHIGIAREIAVLSNLKYLKYIGSTHVFKEDESKRAKDFIQVEVRNKEDCPRYSAKIIFGIKVKSSAKWIQERLKTCGLQPINNIVDTVNYVMLETGQPLHSFDFDKVEKKIIVRRAKKGEKIKALDDKTYQLDKDILVIADKKIPLAIAGIKGGVSTAIGSGTKNIIIEAANFNSRLIRRASQKLKLKTDASWRFENGIDPNLIDFS